jgi:hypothetical protein
MSLAILLFSENGSLLVALFGPSSMSELSPQCAAKQTWIGAIGPALSVGAVADKLLEINATDAFGLIVAKNIGRAARRVLFRFLQEARPPLPGLVSKLLKKTVPTHRATPLGPS